MGSSGKRILILEDEPIIRGILGEMLRGTGFEVFESGNGEDALGRFEATVADGSPFDLVVCDLTLPGVMDGREVLEKCREMQPSLKAIIASGYADDDIMANFTTEPATEILRKPYNVVDFLELVQKMLS